MLTNELMGYLALGILWVNTLLVAGAAWQQMRALLDRRSAMRPLAPGAIGEGLLKARVARGDGSGGAIAVQRIEQVGRAVEGDTAIVFHDRSAKGEITGGAIEDGGDTLTVAAQAEAEVWLTADEIAKVGACASPAAFDEAFTAARKARGFARTIAAEVAEGREVFVCGRVEEKDGARVIGPAKGGLLVATMDPRAVLARKAALALAFIVGEIGLAAACTTIALWPPIFGRVSTIGGALCLFFFLLVQPAGTAVRDAILVPSRAIVRGTWKRAAATGEAAAQTA
ncbi:MAG: hypothetical protein QM820_47645 [Minicystis sp.]